MRCIVMFESTQPVEAAELMRVSAFRRYVQNDTHTDSESARLSTRLTALHPSLVQDLRRFEAPAGPAPALELLEVLAAAMRHGNRLRIHLQYEARTLPLTVFPAQRLVYCPVPMAMLMELPLCNLQVLHVEPAVLNAPGDPKGSRLGVPRMYTPLGPLLWELSLRGAREDLLPEVSGVAAYRVAPGTDLSALDLTGTVSAAIYRLQRDNANLRDISRWPGFDRGLAMRLINALYLQAALIVSRMHPAASQESWQRSQRGGPH